jgi:hypothetical protein
MKVSLRDQEFSAQRFTKLYITALSLVALFAILSQLFIQFALVQQYSDAAIVNIAGRQRMLSQKLTKASLALLITPNPTDRQNRTQEVRDTLNLWITSQAGLQHGNAQLDLPGNNSQDVKQLFAAIEPNFQSIQSAATQLLTVATQDPNESSATFNSAITPFIQTMLTEEPTFLTGMDRIVFQYQLESEARVTQLKLIELTLLGLTLLVLLLEGTMIFRPAVQRLQRSVAALVKAEEQVAARSLELEQKNSELELALHEALTVHRKVMPHARVVAMGHYQVQGSQGQYYNVVSRDVHGALQLECECLIYKRNLICSHSLAAATLHSALLRQHGGTTRRMNTPTPETQGGSGAEWNQRRQV